MIITFSLFFNMDSVMWIFFHLCSLSVCLSFSLCYHCLSFFKSNYFLLFIFRGILLYYIFQYEYLLSSIQWQVKDFERNGLNLTLAKREELQRLKAQLDDLSIQYIRNINDDGSFLLFNEMDLLGLPPEFLRVDCCIISCWMLEFVTLCLYT